MLIYQDKSNKKVSYFLKTSCIYRISANLLPKSTLTKAKSKKREKEKSWNKTITDLNQSRKKGTISTSLRFSKVEIIISSSAADPK